MSDARGCCAEGSYLVLSLEDWEAFCERLDKPRTDLKGVKRLLSEPSVFVEADDCVCTNGAQ